MAQAQENREIAQFFQILVYILAGEKILCFRQSEILEWLGHFKRILHNILIGLPNS